MDLEKRRDSTRTPLDKRGKKVHAMKNMKLIPALKAVPLPMLLQQQSCLRI